MPEPAVSVVIPVHDGERYLAEAVESVLRQTVPPAEVVVVDDGSTDASADVAAAFGDPVRVLRRAHAGGPAASAAGVAAAGGEVLGFLDADDLWEPEKLEVQLEALGRRDPPDLVFGLVEEFVSPDVDAATLATLRAPRPPAPGPVVITLLVRRATFDAVGGFGGDRRARFLDWYLRARDAGCSELMVDRVVARRRLHGTNTSAGPSAARLAFPDALRASLARRRAAADGS